MRRVEDYHRRGHRGRLELYRLVEEGRVRLRDPRPPASLAEYLARPAYTLWLWTGVALLAAWALALSLGAPVPVRLVLGLIVTLLLPGYYTLRLLRPQGTRPLEELVYSIALSLVVVPLVSLALALTVGFSTGAFNAALAVYTLAAAFLAAARSYQPPQRTPGSSAPPRAS